MPVRVERVEAKVTFRLRQQVLRPGRSLDAILLDGEDGELTGSFVARDSDTGEVLSTATVWPEAPPWDRAAPSHSAHAGHDPYEVPALAASLAAGNPRAPWRLRAMATVEAHRGEGLGRRVLDATVEHVVANGGALVWCTAREKAIPFYERAGFEGLGGRFEEVDFGPHLLMWRALDVPTDDNHD